MRRNALELNAYPEQQAKLSLGDLTYDDYVAIFQGVEAPFGGVLVLIGSGCLIYRFLHRRT